MRYLKNFWNLSVIFIFISLFSDVQYVISSNETTSVIAEKRPILDVASSLDKIFPDVDKREQQIVHGMQMALQLAAATGSPAAFEAVIQKAEELRQELRYPTGDVTNEQKKKLEDRAVFLDEKVIKPLKGITGVLKILHSKGCLLGEKAPALLKQFAKKIEFSGDCAQFEGIQLSPDLENIYLQAENIEKVASRIGERGVQPEKKEESLELAFEVQREAYKKTRQALIENYYKNVITFGLPEEMEKNKEMQTVMPIDADEAIRKVSGGEPTAADDKYFKQGLEDLASYQTTPSERRVNREKFFKETEADFKRIVMLRGDLIYDGTRYSTADAIKRGQLLLPLEPQRGKEDKVADDDIQPVVILPKDRSYTDHEQYVSGLSERAVLPIYVGPQEKVSLISERQALHTTARPLDLFVRRDKSEGVPLADVALIYAAERQGIRVPEWEKKKKAYVDDKLSAEEKEKMASLLNGVEYFRQKGASASDAVGFLRNFLVRDRPARTAYRTYLPIHGKTPVVLERLGRRGEVVPLAFLRDRFGTLPEIQRDLPVAREAAARSAAEHFAIKEKLKANPAWGSLIPFVDFGVNFVPGKEVLTEALVANFKWTNKALNHLEELNDKVKGAEGKVKRGEADAHKGLNDAINEHLKELLTYHPKLAFEMILKYPLFSERVCALSREVFGTRAIQGLKDTGVRATGAGIGIGSLLFGPAGLVVGPAASVGLLGYELKRYNDLYENWEKAKFYTMTGLEEDPSETQAAFDELVAQWGAAAMAGGAAVLDVAGSAALAGSLLQMTPRQAVTTVRGAALSQDAAENAVKKALLAAQAQHGNVMNAKRLLAQPVFKGKKAVDLTPNERVEYAESLLGRKLDSSEIEAMKEAHLFGLEDFGFKPKEFVSLPEEAQQDLIRKIIFGKDRRLASAFRDKIEDGEIIIKGRADRQKLIRGGVVGDESTFNAQAGLRPRAVVPTTATIKRGNIALSHERPTLTEAVPSARAGEFPEFQLGQKYSVKLLGGTEPEGIDGIYIGYQEKEGGVSIALLVDTKTGKTRLIEDNDLINYRIRVLDQDGKELFDSGTNLNSMFRRVSPLEEATPAVAVPPAVAVRRPEVLLVEPSLPELLPPLPTALLERTFVQRTIMDTFTKRIRVTDSADVIQIEPPANVVTAQGKESFNKNIRNIGEDLHPGVVREANGVIYVDKRLLAKASENVRPRFDQVVTAMKKGKNYDDLADILKRYPGSQYHDEFYRTAYEIPVVKEMAELLEGKSYVERVAILDAIQRGEKKLSGNADDWAIFHVAKGESKSAAGTPTLDRVLLKSRDEKIGVTLDFEGETIVHREVMVDRGRNMEVPDSIQFVENRTTGKIEVNTDGMSGRNCSACHGIENGKLIMNDTTVPFRVSPEAESDLEGYIKVIKGFSGEPHSLNEGSGVPLLETVQSSGWKSQNLTVSRSERTRSDRGSAAIPLPDGVGKIGDDLKSAAARLVRRAIGPPKLGLNDVGKRYQLKIDGRAEPVEVTLSGVIRVPKEGGGEETVWVFRNEKGELSAVGPEIYGDDGSITEIAGSHTSVAAPRFGVTDPEISRTVPGARPGSDPNRTLLERPAVSGDTVVDQRRADAAVVIPSSKSSVRLPDDIKIGHYLELYSKSGEKYAGTFLKRDRDGNPVILTPAGKPQVVLLERVESLHVKNDGYIQLPGEWRARVGDTVRFTSQSGRTHTVQLTGIKEDGYYVILKLDRWTLKPLGETPSLLPPDQIKHVDSVTGAAGS